MTTGQDFRLCAARLAVASQDRGRRFRGGAESCTWESGASMTQDRLFPGISGFLYRRQDRLSYSHVHRPPNAHMGTRQLVLTESGEPQDHAESQRPLRRSLLSHVQVPRHTIRTAPRRTGRRPAAGRGPQRSRPREPLGPRARHHQAQPLGNRPYRTVASHASASIRAIRPVPTPARAARPDLNHGRVNTHRRPAPALPPNRHTTPPSSPY